jgi:hypothetical protein
MGPREVPLEDGIEVGAFVALAHSLVGSRAGSVEPKPTQRVRHTGLGNLTPEEHAEAYPLNYDLAARDKDSE